MDHASFDRYVRLLGQAGSRRAALGALLGAGLASTVGLATAKKKRKQGTGGADLSTEAADCLSPGPSSNMNGCNFEGDDFSGDDLSSSKMVGTIFRNAELVETDLASSNLKDANFRGANLCGADLSASTLKNADFRGFAAPGRPTNLTNADLHSSGCAGMQTNARTIFCNTIGCDGQVINPGCTDTCAGTCILRNVACPTGGGTCCDEFYECGNDNCDIPFGCCGQDFASCTNSCDCCGQLACQGGVCSV